MILSSRFTVSLDLPRDYITLSILSCLPHYRPLSFFSLVLSQIMSLFLYTYISLSLFFMDVRLTVSLCLSLSHSVSLSPSPRLPVTLPLSPSFSHPAPSLFPSLLLSLTLPLALFPFLTSLLISVSLSFLSALADIYIYIRLHIRDGALCNDYVYMKLGRSPQQTAIFLLLSNQLAFNLLASTFIFGVNYPCIFQ